MNTFFKYLVLLLWGATSIVYGDEITDFDRYTMANGLSNNTISSVCQDYQGYLWVGTFDGLNKYDGYHWKTYRKGSSNKGLISNHIKKMIDFQHRLWVATDNGLSLYDNEGDVFSRVSISKEKEETVSDILLDSQDNLWTSVIGKGLFRLSNIDSLSWTWCVEADNIVALDSDKDSDLLWYATQNGQLVCYSTLTTQQESFFLPSVQIVDILNTSHEIWIGTEANGVFIFDKDQKTFTRFKLDPSVKVTREITQGSDGTIWITTDGDGVYAIGQYGKIERKFKFKGSPAVLTVLKDNEGVEWYGTVGLGLWARNPIKSYYGYQKIHTGELDQDLLINNILSFCQWTDNILLVGTDGGGLWAYDLNKKRRMDQLPFPAINAKVIKAIYRDFNGDLWIGTYKKGIFRLRKNGSKWEHLNRVDQTASLINNVWTVIDNKEKVFIGTLGKGVFYLNSKGGFESLVSSYSKEIDLRHYILSSLNDSNGNLWFGSSNGLLKYNSDDNRMISMFANPSNQNGRGRSSVTSLLEDHDQKIWIGTNGGGIGCFKEDTIQWINETKGLINNTVMSILQDSIDRVWVMTNRGISVLNSKTEKLIGLDESNGLQSLQFTCATILNDGRFVLGTVNGLYLFNPLKVHYDISPPKLVLEKMTFADRENKKYHLYRKDHEPLLWLPKYSAFNLKFTGIDYIQKEKAEYRYRIDGYIDQWISVGDQRYLTLMGLPYGDFNIRVRCGYPNVNSISNEIVIPIKVLRPWWRTKSAFLLYLIILMVIVWIYQMLANRFYSLKKEAELEQLDSKRKQELHKVRIEMFTKMAHEFMTPLTLIIAPIKEIIEKEGNKFRYIDKLKLVYQQSEYLQKLAENILAFQKMSIHTPVLHLSFFDINDLVERKISEFQTISEKKRIAFDFSPFDPTMEVELDFEKIETIMSNLFSNALKYGEEDSVISVSIDRMKNKEGLLVVVSDTGIGIPKDKIDNIFHPFFRVNEASSEVGTGIGLSIVRDFVHVHKGTISVESTEGSGTTFILNLPCQLKEKTAFLDSINQNDTTPYTEYVEESSSDLVPSLKCLVVDDHISMLHYLNDLLKDKYQVVLATNGEQGYKMALQHMPDIIITDLMMPQVDGIELLSLLKKNNITSHIPVIVLSAKHVVEAKIASVDEGAELYLSKPFDPHLIISYIDSILQNRARLANQRRGVIKLHEQSTLSPIDQKWVASLRETILKNLQNSKLSVDFLCQSMNMSRTSLHRKLKAICNESTTEFMNGIRLEKAMELLETRNYQISEVAYMVGFNNASYFTRAFSKKFHVTPSEFLDTL